MGLAGLLQRHNFKNKPSEGFNGVFLHKKKFPIAVTDLLHMGPLVSIICAGIGERLGREQLNIRMHITVRVKKCK